MNKAKNFPSAFLKQVVELDREMEKLDESIKNSRIIVHNLFWQSVENKKSKTITK